MPCNCDHMEPNVRERQLHRAAKVLVWVKTKMGKAVPDYAKKAAGDVYGGGKNGERAVNELCTLLGQMHQTRLQKFFDEQATDPMSHEARSWWAEHQQADSHKAGAQVKLDLGLNANDIKVGGKLIRR